MKRYYEFNLTANNGKQHYFLIDVTKISLISHDSDNGVNGTTIINLDNNNYSFRGMNNKSIYDDIVSLMHELETEE